MDLRLDSAAIAREIASLRSDCRFADLKVEQAQRVHDEVAHSLEVDGLDEVEIEDAEHYVDEYERVLEGLLDVEFEEVPPAVGFADKTILAEIKATRQLVADAVERCKAAYGRMIRRSDQRPDPAESTVPLSLLSDVREQRPRVLCTLPSPSDTKPSALHARPLSWSSLALLRRPPRRPTP